MMGRAAATYAKLAGVLMICSTFALGMAPAAAQEVTPEQRAELEALFTQIVKDPTDLDLTYEYGKRAAAFGDYEAAITAYERLLLFNPNLPRVKAELGVMYFRLGSLDTARAYLEQARNEGNAPPEVVERLDRLLTQIDERQSPHKFSSSLAFGLRYQTNANFGPGGQIVVFDTLVDPDSETQADDDVNAFASLSGRYLYDFGDDSGDFFKVEGALYAARQLTVTELDVEQLQIKAGPGFNIYPKTEGPLLFQPAIRFTYVRLDNETYNVSVGGEFRTDWRVRPDTGLFFETFAEARHYQETGQRQNANTQDGGAMRATVGASHKLNPDVNLRGGFFAGRVYADDPSEAYREMGGFFGLTALVKSPVKPTDLAPSIDKPWNVSINARYSNRAHDAANNIVSASKREDDDIRLDTTLAVPMAPSWTVFGTLGMQNNNSTIVNNDFENFSFTLGANVRF